VSQLSSFFSIGDWHPIEKLGATYLTTFSQTFFGTSWFGRFPFSIRTINTQGYSCAEFQVRKVCLKKNKTTEKDTFVILAKDTMIVQPPPTQSGGRSWTNFLVLQSCLCSIRSSTMSDAEASMTNSTAPSDEKARSAPVSSDMLEALVKSYQEHFSNFGQSKNE
jgi:hypothetical protein